MQYQRIDTYTHAQNVSRLHNENNVDMTRVDSSIARKKHDDRAT